MPHPDCPTLRDIDHAQDVFDSERKDKTQRGRNKQPKYFVLAHSPGARLVNIWWTEKLHPHDQQPDFRPDAPSALIDGPTAPDSFLWARFRHKKKLATLLAAAIERMDFAPWPL